jgi:putative phosphoesterase
MENEAPIRRIGVISDTHGLVRPQAVDALAGIELIIHAGDIGSEAVLDELGTIAPVRAVRGNNDQNRWARRIPETLELEIGRFRVFVIHDVKALDFDPAARGIDLVVAGHSHRPKIDRKNGVLYLNPGSAGPRRFTLPISLAVIDVAEASLDPRLITLDVYHPAP